MRQSVSLLLGMILIAACDVSDGRDRKNYFAPMVRPSDFAVLTGDDWEGELTYLNHEEPPKEITLAADLAVAQNANTFELYISYPDAPRADGRAELTVSEDGRLINDEKVVERSREDGALVLESRQDCEDAGRPALCEHTYQIAPEAFSIRKMVTPEDEGEAFQRNFYEFTR